MKRERPTMIGFDGAPGRLLISSATEPGKYYHITRLASGRVTCDCRGFAFRGRCNHLRRAREWLRERKRNGVPPYDRGHPDLSQYGGWDRPPVKKVVL